jgi:hypothetical protein
MQALTILIFNAGYGYVPERSERVLSRVQAKQLIRRRQLYVTVLAECHLFTCYLRAPDYHCLSETR